MTEEKTLTFLDANVLIAAATGMAEVSRRALNIVDDPDRRFATSTLVRLETLPKALFHGWGDAADFYKSYFDRVEVWADDLNAIVDSAFDEAVQHDIAPRDALHVAAAAAVGATELITAERPTTPMLRTSRVTVHSIHPGADQ